MSPEKFVTLVDAQGQKIGQTELLAAHRHPAQLHLAASVWLFRGRDLNREVLFQKRSISKIVGANQWGNGICGNVQPDEDAEACAFRRLREEIGVEAVKLKPIYRFEYQVYSNELYGEHELDQVYLADYDGEFRLNPDEVQEIVWLKLSDLERQLQTIAIVSASQTLGRSTAELRELTPPLFLAIGGRTYEITPWTAIMLGDQRLLEALRNF